MQTIRQKCELCGKPYRKRTIRVDDSDIIMIDYHHADRTHSVPYPAILHEEVDYYLRAETTLTANVWANTKQAQ